MNTEKRIYKRGPEGAVGQVFMQLSLKVMSNENVKALIPTAHQQNFPFSYLSTKHKYRMGSEQEPRFFSPVAVVIGLPQRKKFLD